MPDCRIDFLNIKVCLKGMFKLPVDIKLTIHFCHHISTNFFIENDLNSGFSCFGVRVSVMFHFMCVHYTFSSVWVAEWPPFGK